MKRILSIITVFLLAVTLVACGKSKEIEEVKETLGVLFEDPDNIKSGFVLPTEFNYDVKGKWTSSDVDFLQIGQADDEGMVQVSVTRPKHTENNRKVTLSIELKLGKKKDTWSIELTIAKTDAPAYYGDSLKDALSLDTAGKSIEVTGVQLGGSLGTAGYYLLTKDGSVAYVHGTSTKPAAGKLYNITATVDNYFNALQLKDVNFTEVTGTADHEIKYAPSSVENIANFELPSNTNALGQAPYKLKNVRLVIDKDIKDEKYNLFLVADGHKGTRNNKNSLMVYYESTVFDALKALENDEGYIEELDVLLSGYRTDKNIWYVSTLVAEADIKYSSADHIAVTKALVTLDVPTLKYDDVALDLKTTVGELAVTWTTSNAEVIKANGEVLMPSERTNVVLKASITKGTVTLTKEFPVSVTEVITIAEAKKEKNSTKFQIKGVVLGTSGNNTMIIQDETGGMYLDIYKLADSGIKVGDLVTVEGTKKTSYGRHVLDSLSVIDVEGTHNIEFTPTNLESRKLDETLIDLQGTLVSLDQMIVKRFSKDSYNNITMTLLRLDGEEITFKYDSRVNVSGENSILTTLKEGDVIKLTNVPMHWDNGPVVGFDNANQLSLISDTTDELDLEIAKILLPNLNLEFSAEGTLDLVETSNGIPVTWTFKDANNDANKFVNLETGTVTIEKDKLHEVVIVATLTKGNKKITADFMIELLGLDIERFENHKLSSSYGDTTYTGAKGIVWTITHSRNSGLGTTDDYSIDEEGVMLRRGSDSSISVTFEDGISEFSFDARKAFTGGTTRTLIVTINGVDQEVTLESVAGADDTVFTFDFEVEVEGPVTIVIKPKVSGNHQTTIDNFKWIV